VKTPPVIQIATSGLGDSSITDETSLIRYMKLSTFLLLVSKNRLFLPTVQKLQESDLREANIQLYYCSAYWRKMWPLVKPHKPWLLSDVLRPNAPEAWDEPSEQRKQDLIRAWAGALAERRSVWCWNRSVDESYALWKIYGERGVAIYSKVGQLRTALQNAGVKSGIVSPVTYIGKKEQDTQKRYDREMKAMTSGKNLHRPYLFKHFGFHLEEEVRFVIRTNPKATSLRNGAVIRIMAKDFITSFKFSDDIPDSEQWCLQDLANQELSKDVVVPEHDSEIDFLNPFSTANELSGVFTDLD
jgi:hypothetical protein